MGEGGSGKSGTAKSSGSAQSLREACTGEGGYAIVGQFEVIFSHRTVGDKHF